MNHACLACGGAGWLCSDCGRTHRGPRYACRAPGCISRRKPLQCQGVKVGVAYPHVLWSRIDSERSVAPASAPCIGKFRTCDVCGSLNETYGSIGKLSACPACVAKFEQWSAVMVDRFVMENGRQPTDPRIQPAPQKVAVSA